MRNRSFTDPIVMERAAKLFLGGIVNILGATAASLICWAVMTLFDAKPALAESFSAVCGVGILVLGHYIWAYDRDFLDTSRIVVLLGVIFSILCVLMIWELGAHFHGPWSPEAVVAYWRVGTPGWQRLLASMVFFFFVPFLAGSAVRSAAIGIFVHGLGTPSFGLVPEQKIRERNERKPTPGASFVSSEAGAIVFLAMFWPGIWALFQMHDGRWAAGALAMVLWLAGLSLFCIWLHRRQLVSLWVSGSSLVAVMVAAIWVIWR